MAIQKLPVAQFLALANEHLVLDVRSPSEFSHAHIPNAHSLPLFSDEERKIVGITYKQLSREEAIKKGLDFFGGRMRKVVEEVESLIVNQTAKIILVHCWRGGMRSAAIAWLLDLYGYKVYTLQGGYKAFRNWVLQQFEQSYSFTILGGYTGSGKTDLLQEISKNHQVINLEGLANHKGSAFGALGEKAQPSQEMFENLLAIELLNKFSSTENKTPVWLEDESQRIGNLFIPNNLWMQMRQSRLYFIDIPFEQRLDYLVKTYGCLKKDYLVNAIIRIQKRLGGLDAKNAINFLLENNTRECFSILLKYYDKCYSKALHNRTNFDLLMHKISCDTVSINNIKNLGILHQQS